MTAGSPAESATHFRRTLNHLTPGRDCGDCVACCQVLRIDQPDLQKAAGILCTHNTGTGCGIYATRPGICRSWYCLWRRIDAMPDAARPDRCGVIFCLEEDGAHGNLLARFCVVARAVSTTRAFQRGIVKEVIAMFARQGDLPVWRHRWGAKTLSYPSPELADAIERPDLTPFMAFLPAARMWLARHRV